MDQPSDLPFREKRRTERLVITGQVEVRLLRVVGSLVMRNIGPGGCMVEGGSSVIPGAPYRLSVRTPRGWSPFIDTVVVHCRRLPGDRRRYSIGLSFLPDPGQEAVERVIDEIAATASVR